MLSVRMLSFFARTHPADYQRLAARSVVTTLI